MILLKLKHIKTKYYPKAIMLMIIITGLCGCNLFTKKEIKHIYINNYCQKHIALSQHDNIKKDINIISNELFQYIKINETTYTCECLDKEQKQECYNQFLQL